MRVSRQQAEANRERILTETARLIREAGIDGVGVDALTRAAGLTHGSLYSQFGSKQALVEAALEHALAAGHGRYARQPGTEPAAAFAKMVERYLSPAHRDRPGSGCALAALATDAPRQGGSVRAIFTSGVQRFVDRLATLLPGNGTQPAEAAALATAATMIGALVLARAVDDPALSDRILAASAARLLPDAPTH